jgi:hypothetical protein
MRVLAWLTPPGWEACVDAVAALPGAGAVTLLAVAGEAPEAAGGALAGLLGRRERGLEHRLGEEEAEAGRALLEAGQARLGREARLELRAGRVEREVVAAAAGADLLVLCRDGRRPGPRSLEHPLRFVVDHAPCALLVIWRGGRAEDVPLPPPREHPHPPPPPPRR